MRSKRKRNTRAITRAENRPLKTKTAWVITAVKKTGGGFYYAGGARLSPEISQAVKFPSVIHATRVKEHILSDFPKSLTSRYLWSLAGTPA